MDHCVFFCYIDGVPMGTRGNGTLRLFLLHRWRSYGNAAFVGYFSIFIAFFGERINIPTRPRRTVSWYQQSVPAERYLGNNSPFQRNGILVQTTRSSGTVSWYKQPVPAERYLGTNNPFQRNGILVQTTRSSGKVSWYKQPVPAERYLGTNSPFQRNGILVQITRPSGTVSWSLLSYFPSSAIAFKTAFNKS